MVRATRRWIIERSLAANVGHVGSALSITDIMAVLWHGVMDSPGTTRPARDRFILGKGHAALVLYCSLRYRGLLEEEEFRGYCADGSRLGGHPEHALPGVDLSTGSLGLSLSVACGLAYGFRLKELDARVYVLLSDAECNEGQVWEAAMFAAHHELAGLCAIVDLNGLQALGHTREVIRLDQGAIWRGFRWEVVEVDGHDRPALHAALSAPASRPRVVLARTVMGKGVPFMEDQLDWHYRNLTPELAAEALACLEAAP
jgi:transketolase